MTLLAESPHPVHTMTHPAQTLAALLTSAAATLAQTDPAPLLGDTGFRVPGSPAALCVADLQADGVPEVIVARFDSSTLDIFDGAGTLLHSEPLAEPAVLLEAFDADGDGLLDLCAVAGGGNPDARILLGDGAFGFTHLAPFVAPGVPRAIRAGDFEGDGDVDLLLPYTLLSTDAEVAFFRNAGAGTFARILSDLSTPGNTVGQTRFVDVNADGLRDVVAVGGGSAHVYLAAADGHFAFDSSHGAGDTILALQVLDVDDDGAVDVLATVDAFPALNALRMLPGPGPDFGPAQTLHQGPGASHQVAVQMLAEDWSADGLPDVVASLDLRSQAGGPAVAWNLPAAFSPSGEGTDLGDVDGDGQVELIRLDQTTKPAGWRIEVRNLTPDGDVGLLELDATPSAPNMVAAQLIDLDLDGDLDVLGRTAHAVVPLLAQPGGGFSTLPAQAVGADVVALAALDRGSDGIPDVLTISIPSAVSPFFGVFDGVGDGTFTEQQLVTLDEPMLDLAAGDLDGDGHVDAVLAPLAGDGWQRLFGPTFSALPKQLGNVRRIELGDLDADGVLDLVSVPASGATVSVRLGDGLGDFGVPSTHPAAPEVTHLALGDLDVDGDLDVASAGRALAVSLGLGDGDLAAPQYHALTDDASGLTLTDLEGDGLPEVIVHGEGLAVLPGGGAPIEESLGPIRASSLLVAELDDAPGLELLLFNTLGLNGQTALMRQRPTAPWTGLGAGLAGAAGFPRLAAAGSQHAGEDVRVWLSKGPASGTAFLVLGVSEFAAPFKGGTLVPSPDVLLTLPLDALGSVAFALPWPAGLSGLTLWWQAWMPDVTQPLGFSASNALTSTAP